MKNLLTLLGLLICSLNTFSQIENPVKWTFSSNAVDEEKAELIIKADIQPGWHVYSQFIAEGGPVPTSFKFSPSADYSLSGKVIESPKATSSFDKNFNMQIAWHEKQVIFKQLIKVKRATSVKGVLEFMVCNDEKCLPPEEVEFNIPVSVKAAAAPVPAQLSVNPATDNTAVPLPDSSTSDTVASPAGDATDSPDAVSLTAATQADNTLAGIFIAGFLGGLLAFFMPCIYPMIPLTVSFFTKKTGSRSKGIQSATIYGLSIIVIYVALGLLITIAFGASALNEAASSATFNLIFFAILLIFAISFLGAFEITLPSSLVNKMDEKSNKGGLIGVFFMAFTLALVSFSCTGPIIGTLLVETVSNGTYLGPAMGMLGFSTALAIPFTLFAIFPSWLKELPKSGGWMNTVKVSLGFLELALAFKFLSNVDLAYHWNVLDRDIFLAIWIVVFGVWGLYLLGKFKLAHDVEVGFISLTRLFFAMLVLGFTLYMIPGLWGAPLKTLSGWLPPIGTQDFNLYSQKPKTSEIPKKYAGVFHPAHTFEAFYDFEEGLAYARKVNKPALIDFTGHTCTNCRRMEGSVWSDPQVDNIIRNDYVLISLYVDDKTELAENEKYVSESGKKIKTLGNKWSDLQAKKFKTNSQPYYVIVNPDGETLVPPQAFNLDIKNYINFLESGKAAFNKL
ncbi:cytochrome c biogenesis protein CcdA [Paradesertivirga mongoliensis]|uniref:Cytochrome c biogenesis protein CcdA n=1 Tax=Paradesertivirga mongoliensis TaxID=2100740 RepID=A0ABW4ZHA4_9SPHI|nr:thioredoxin family protein [Pedobacter mongoliensis]